MNNFDDERTHSTAPTGSVTDLSCTSGRSLSTNASSLPRVPQASDLGIASGNRPNKSQDDIYGLETGGIASYVVTPQEPEPEIVDAIKIVPELKVIEEEKKNKRMHIIGGIVLFVVIVIVVTAIVVLTFDKGADNDDSAGNLTGGYTSILNATSPPSQSPSTPPTSGTFLDLLSVLGGFYDADEFDTIFEDESSPQYRAAAWVADTAFLPEVDGDEARMISRFALATFYFSTNGDGWRHSASRGWLKTPNECEWNAISCNDDSSVATIFFKPNGGISSELTGTLPYEISFLSKLTMFIVPKGPISGPFPDWTKLSSLEMLALNNHQFSGEFPSYLIRQNPLLDTIYFRNNKFEGHIFKDDFTIDSSPLLALHLDGNNFSGSISSQIWRLTSLTDLCLNGNNFSGSIPSELGRLKLLEKLNVGNNGFTGTIPDELYTLTTLRNLDLSVATFHGSLSDSFSDLAELTTAIFHNNDFTGTIPAGFADLTKLKKLELHSNDLSDSVSEELCARKATDLTLTVDCQKVTCSCCTECVETR